MNTVQFAIHRKASFRGALLPYRLYMNGTFIGTLKNGQTLTASVPQAAVYYIDVDYPFDRNAVYHDQGVTDVSVVLKRAGGWRTDSYIEFYLDTENGLHPLPSFHFERFAKSVYGDKLDTLDADERVLAVCLEFWNAISESVDEVLASENYHEILHSLHRIGANQYEQLLERVSKDLFPGIELPLTDEQLEQLSGKVDAANQMIWKNEKPASEEFRKAIVDHMLRHLITEDNCSF